MVNVQPHFKFSNEIIILNLILFGVGRGEEGGRAERKGGGGWRKCAGTGVVIHTITYQCTNF